jgi:hypothetical protein
VEATPDEFRPLLAAELPDVPDRSLVEQRLNDAVVLFRSRSSSQADRRRAVRDLADGLEPLRATIKAEALSKDESELFRLANGFAIRHNNRDQLGFYDDEIWLRWAFYVYLATIHATLRLQACAATARAQQLGACLFSRRLALDGHGFANRAGDRMVDESSRDAGDTRHVNRPSTAVHDVVPGVFHEFEIHSVVDVQLGDARTDERDETISLLFSPRCLRDRLDGDRVINEAVCRTYTFSDGLEVPARCDRDARDVGDTCHDTSSLSQAV